MNPHRSDDADNVDREQAEDRHDHADERTDHAEADNLFTLGEVARLLRVPPATLRYWRHQHNRTAQLPHRPTRPLLPKRRRGVAAPSARRRRSQRQVADSRTYRHGHGVTADQERRSYPARCRIRPRGD